MPKPGKENNVDIKTKVHFPFELNAQLKLLKPSPAAGVWGRGKRLGPLEKLDRSAS
jgi:hypothetical protein